MACAVRQQDITWANVDLDLCRHMVSLGQNASRNMNRHLHTFIDDIMNPLGHSTISHSFDCEIVIIHRNDAVYDLNWYAKYIRSGSSN